MQRHARQLPICGSQKGHDPRFFAVPAQESVRPDPVDPFAGNRFRTGTEHAWIPRAFLSRVATGTGPV